jgi:DNA polymerase-1
MLLIRALWPSLPLVLHEKAGTDLQAEKHVNGSKLGGIAGIGLEAVALALGLNMPQGKAYQKPENWVPSALTLEHYEYATADTTIVLDIIHRVLKHVGIKDISLEQAWDALEAKNPGGWTAYRDAFAPAIPLLAGMHRLGLPLDLNALESLLETKDKEVRAHAEELIKIIPELSPHLDDLVHGGLTNGIKQAIAAHIECQGVKLEVKNQSKLTEIGDNTLKKAGADKPEIENQLESSQKAVENTSKITSISEDSLKKMGADKLPFYHIWIKLREALKIRQMLESLQELAGIDGRLHSLISIAADTGRTTSQEPNLQNFPRDPAFRALVRARTGYVLVDADLGAIEMRVAAALAERAIKDFCKGGPRQKELPSWILDANAVLTSNWQRNKKAEFYTAVGKIAQAGYRSRLAEVFRSGADPHTATGLSLMREAGVAPPDMPEDSISWLASMTPDERQGMKKKVGVWRQKAKALNFGLLYGQAAEGLYFYGITSYNLAGSKEEAARSREVWLNAYPEIVFWQLVSELAGSRRMMLSAKDRHSKRVERKERRVFMAKTLSGRPVTALSIQPILNYQDQGTAAEMLLMAMARLPDDLQKCIVNIIHDEILLEVPIDSAWRAQVALEEAMVGAAEVWLQPWGVSAEADAASGKTWADTKT